jgi:hypothetical protein
MLLLMIFVPGFSAKIREPIGSSALARILLTSVGAEALGGFVGAAIEIPLGLARRTGLATLVGVAVGGTSLMVWTTSVVGPRIL